MSSGTNNQAKELTTQTLIDTSISYSLLYTHAMVSLLFFTILIEFIVALKCKNSSFYST